MEYQEFNDREFNIIPDIHFSLVKFKYSILRLIVEYPDLYNWTLDTTKRSNDLIN